MHLPTSNQRSYASTLLRNTGQEGMSCSPINTSTYVNKLMHGLTTSKARWPGKAVLRARSDSQQGKGYGKDYLGLVVMAILARA